MANPIKRGSFEIANQNEVSGYMLGKPEEWTIARYNNALKYLGAISPSSVDMWLTRPGPDGQVSVATPGSGDFANPKGTAVVDCRITPLGPEEWQQKIKNSYYCGGKMKQSNAEIFKTAFESLNSQGLLNKPPARVVFYDNWGQHRGPEMALRYIDRVLQFTDHKDFINKHDVFFLDGGVSQYAKDIPKSAFLAPVTTTKK
ncbi:hypothetical protein E8E14_010327 [Neopestalotiopsis sp. 37M]|nr:hypothetical protein E8E14_010327 [Neopestalotiopsis sp. 37M]